MISNFRILNLIFIFGICIQLFLIYDIWNRDTLTMNILTKVEELIKIEYEEKIKNISTDLEDKLKGKEKEIAKLKEINKNDILNLKIKKLPLEIRIYDRNDNLKNSYILPNWAIGLNIGDRVEIEEKR